MNPKPRPRGGADPLRREGIRADLAEARERTLWLVDPVAEADMDRVHDPLMSPLVWDLAHIAAFEELWLCHRIGGLEPLHPDLLQVYDALETPRAVRGEVPHLDLAGAHDYLARVRERSLEVLARADVRGRAGELWEMVVQHEHQHNETMLQTLALAAPGVYVPRAMDVPRPRPARRTGGMVRIEAGPFVAGTSGPEFVYDNEKPAFEVDLPAYAIDALPATNGDYLEFVDDGGYERREWWSEEGWAWRREAGVERPLYWTADGLERRFEALAAVDASLPVMHVSWHEADAFARSRGKRLPTELEWEKAAAWGPEVERPRIFPWGDEAPDAPYANVDQLRFGPVAAGALAAGGSAYGVLGLVGDAWEWTSSAFRGYEGFRAHPYREYSEVFFGPRYRVLRGGSWATRTSVVRNSFRNWDLPERRQIFCGFRCAGDA